MAKTNQKAIQQEKTARAHSLGRKFTDAVRVTDEILAALASLATGKYLPKYARDEFQNGAIERELELSPFNPESLDSRESESDKARAAREEKARKAHGNTIFRRVQKRVNRAMLKLESEHGVSVQRGKQGGGDNAKGSPDKQAAREAVTAIRSAEAPAEPPKSLQSRGVKTGKAKPDAQSSVDALAMAIVASDAPKESRNIAWGALAQVAAFLKCEI